MTTIEERALALVNAQRDHLRPLTMAKARGIYRGTIKTLCETRKELEAERADHAATKAEYEAFRQEVSDAVEKALGGYAGASCRAEHLYQCLISFIIPKPDPMVEVAREMVLLDGVVRTDNQKAAIREGRAANIASDDFYDRLRAALAARGLKLVEVGDAD